MALLADVEDEEEVCRDGLASDQKKAFYFAITQREREEFQKVHALEYRKFLHAKQLEREKRAIEYDRKHEMPQRIAELNAICGSWKKDYKMHLIASRDAKKQFVESAMESEEKLWMNLANFESKKMEVARRCADEMLLMHAGEAGLIDYLLDNWQKGTGDGLVRDSMTGTARRNKRRATMRLRSIRGPHKGSFSFNSTTSSSPTVAFNIAGVPLEGSVAELSKSFIPGAPQQMSTAVAAMLFPEYDGPHLMHSAVSHFSGKPLDSEVDVFVKDLKMSMILLQSRNNGDGGCEDDDEDCEGDDFDSRGMSIFDAFVNGLSLIRSIMKMDEAEIEGTRVSRLGIFADKLRWIEAREEEDRLQATAEEQGELSGIKRIFSVELYAVEAVVRGRTQLLQKLMAKEERGRLPIAEEWFSAFFNILEKHVEPAHRAQCIDWAEEEFSELNCVWEATVRMELQAAQLFERTAQLCKRQVMRRAELVWEEHDKRDEIMRMVTEVVRLQRQEENE